ncbi:hypothetical protein A5784_35035 [Mycobacterium sp. 852013-50091_SCH5140682]|uniref:hypothetical protein n=1 Tax=Mycobacterium sp. 852013-50091_SCH5140682 TaxID=1834109 RepID=UPI0007EB689D|nr:hypothetical protein [Mycobacterium sp. 852013-50091_SCH5140682]OBC11415.1 hypothetical protein A5784_35035 [Mycobacterium sp. 852013-50091_SCH5140682]
MTELHRCVVHAGRCLGTELDNRGTKHAAIVTDEGQLCEKCTQHVSKIIGRLVDDWFALDGLLGEKQSQQGVRVSYTASPGVPLNTDAEAKQVQMVELVDLAADIVAAAIDKDHNPPAKRRRRLQAGVALVHPNLSVLLEAPADWVLRWDRSGEVHGEDPTEYVKIGPGKYRGLDRDGNELDGTGGRYVLMSGVDIALELWKLHDLVLGMRGERKRDQRDHMATPCHWCGYRSLYRDHGADLIYCTRCPKGSPGASGYPLERHKELEKRSEFYMKVLREQELDTVKWLLAEKEWRIQVNSWLAAERLWRLTQAATVAGFTVDEFLAALDRVA